MHENGVVVEKLVLDPGIVVFKNNLSLTKHLISRKNTTLMKKQLLFLALATIGLRASSQQFEMWGTTSQGGASNKGTIFKFSGATGGITAEHSFDGTGGNTPNSTLISNNDEFIGVAEGGTLKAGLLFRFNKVTGEYSTIKEFNPAVDGGESNQPIRIGNKIYGSLSNGGSQNGGTIYEYDLVSGIFQKRYDFDTISDGRNPYGKLVEFNGKLYGQTWRGGDNHRGTIFEWDPINNSMTCIYQFKNEDHYYLGESLCVLNDKLYGFRFGSTFQPTCAYLFSIDPVLKNFQYEFDFPGQNEFPSGDLISYNGILYGMYANGIFKFDAANKNLIKLPVFNTFWTERPKGALVLNHDKFYGLTYRGGVTDDGSIFQFDPSNDEFVQRAVFIRSNGAFPLADVFIVGTPSSISNRTNENNHKFWPNPVTDALTITTYRNATYFISDATGRIAFSGDLRKGDNKLETSCLKAGIYLLTITDESGTSTEKLVKQ